MKILNSQQINRIIQHAINSTTLTLDDVIDKVATAVVDEVKRAWPVDQRIFVLAGLDRVGAYAFATAIKLIQNDYLVRVLFLNLGGEPVRETLKYKELLAKIDQKYCFEITGNPKIKFPRFDTSTLVIDGIFGSELTSPLKEGSFYPSFFEALYRTHAPVFSIDLPSGMMSEWNRSNRQRNTVHADKTFAIQYPRLSFLLEDNASAIGEYKVIDLGVGDVYRQSSVETHFHLLERSYVKRLLVRRKPFSTKHDYGHAMIYAGCYGMVGASVLAARGAMRAGAGKVTVHGPLCAHDIMQCSVPDALFHADDNKIRITNMSPGLDIKALAVGPGIGTHDTTISALERLLRTFKYYAVLDADALNCIAQKRTLLNDIKPQTIITPHAGEFDRLFGDHNTAEERLLEAITMAQKYRIFIVLKGHHTAIIRPDGEVLFNTTGNAGMATAGSGDILTGIIVGLLAQGYSPERAATIGVYVHGLAGDIAVREHGEYGVCASDIAECVGKAFDAIFRNSRLEDIK